MEFRTSIHPLDSKGFISHDGGIVMMGSCFSDNIGSRLKSAMFDVDVNPFGTTFNPASINKTIDIALSQRAVVEDSVFLHNGLWHNFDFHSRFSCDDKEYAIQQMNDRITHTHQNLKTAQKLILTFGTSFVYRLASTEEVVNNCHKLAAVRFTRTRLAVDDIVDNCCATISRLLEVNPGLKIIFTVSPIRHLSDGVSGNALSKSTLLLAIDKIVTHFPETCSYFPAYEIMIDDLRDYRFYATDMVHPSDVAIDYIWEIFQQSYFTPQLVDLVCRCTKISKRFAHRHMTDNQELIEKFNNDTQGVIKSLINEYPYLKRVINNPL